MNSFQPFMKDDHYSYILHSSFSIKRIPSKKRHENPHLTRTMRSKKHAITAYNILQINKELYIFAAELQSKKENSKNRRKCTLAFFYKIQTKPSIDLHNYLPLP